MLIEFVSITVVSYYTVITSDVPVERDCNTITVLLLLFQINNQSINQSINQNSLYKSTIRPCAPDLIVNKRSGWDPPTILYLNARSLSEEKLDELQVNVIIHDVSIICVTETWFKHYMDDNNLSIEGFSVVGNKYAMDAQGVELPATLGIASCIND